MTELIYRRKFQLAEIITQIDWNKKLVLIIRISFSVNGFQESKYKNTKSVLVEIILIGLKIHTTSLSISLLVSSSVVERS
jgi:hypothetical protein